MKKKKAAANKKKAPATKKAPGKKKAPAKKTPAKKKSAKKTARRHFELVAGGQRKFWRIQLDGSAHTTTWGRIGTDGQTKTKDFESANEARTSHDKLIAAKLKKGYVEITGTPSSPSSGAAKPATGTTPGRRTKKKTQPNGSKLEAAMRQAFAPEDPPEVLLELLQLDEGDDGLTGFLSDGFEMRPDVRQSGIRTYSEDPAFCSRFVGFAQANGSGSGWSLWRREPVSAWSECPVVIFGDEGGIHVMARNLEEWARLLTLDAEPLASWENADFFRDDDDPDQRTSARIDEYREWVRNRFGRNPLTNDAVDKVVKAAQKSMQDDLIEFARQFTDAFDGYL